MHLIQWWQNEIEKDTNLRVKLLKSNKKVEELHQELQELNAHIVVNPEELLGNRQHSTVAAELWSKH